jgi:hypothetical protein
MTVFVTVTPPPEKDLRREGADIPVSGIQIEFLLRLPNK